MHALFCNVGQTSIRDGSGNGMEQEGGVNCMSKKLRYRLQKKVPIARPNILGNHSFPVHTYQWKDIAASDDREALVKVMPNDRDFRIEDTAPYSEE